jgi:hypothetical protein
MKRFVLSLLILMGCLSGFSQKIYFLYLQSENDQPFFLKMNENIYSSTASGYLIMPRLRDSSYAFTIGFPQNKYPEQKFAVQIKGKDKGYLLKNFADKGWGLFDLQTLTIQMALPDNRSGRIKTEPRDDITPFTEILAKASNDPSLKERPVAVKTPIIANRDELTPIMAKRDESTPIIANRDELTPKETVTAKKDQEVKTKKEQAPVVPPLIKQDTAVVAKRNESITSQTEPSVKQETAKEIVTAKTEEESAKPAQSSTTVKEETALVKEEPAKKKEETKITPAEYKRSVVTKKSESSTSEGLGLIFIDELTDGKKDTIRIVIPNPRNSPAQNKETSKDDKKFLDISANDTSKPSQDEAKATAVTTPAKNKMTNTNCKLVASESDLSKLQKKMIGEKNDDDMVGEAKKVFKNRCFTAAQLKSLSALFMNDAGRYKLFDAGYAYVSDTENFSQLSSELKDEYYINRFKAMLR